MQMRNDEYAVPLLKVNGDAPDCTPPIGYHTALLYPASLHDVGQNDELFPALFSNVIVVTVIGVGGDVNVNVDGVVPAIRVFAGEL